MANTMHKEMWTDSVGGHTRLVLKDAAGEVLSTWGIEDDKQTDAAYILARKAQFLTEYAAENPVVVSSEAI